jgi:hypothetical protein
MNGIGLNKNNPMEMTSKDLKSILEICTSYIENTDDESIELYFNELTRTNLFADAVGKVVSRGGNKVEIITEY